MLPAKARVIKSAFELISQREIDTLAQNFFSNQSIDNIFSNSAVSQIINYTMGIAYAVFAICFLVGLFNISVKNDNFSTQGVFSPLQFFIKAALVKILMDASPNLFKSMMNGAMDLLNYILSSSAGVGTSPDDGKITDEVFTELARHLSLMEAWISWLLTGILSLFLILMTLFIALTFASLIIKIVIYYLITPIGVATLVNDETSLAGKNFLRTLFAFAGELIVIGIVIALYSAIANSVDSFFGVASGAGGSKIINILFNGSHYLQEAVTNKDVNAFTLPISMFSRVFLTVLFIQLLKKAEPISRRLTGAN